MKLLLKRDQGKTLMGATVKFILDARAELSADEKSNVEKYKIGKTLLYTNMEDRGAGLMGVVSRAMKGIELSVNDLVDGKKIECKDIVEMISTEDQIKEACKNFKNVLETAAQFGGEEIVEF